MTSKQHAVGTGHCPQCGHTWGGLKAEHCTICHATFTGNTAGEAHRHGEYPNRTCSTEDLFWNEKRQMWGSTEPGTMPKFWEKDDDSVPEIAEKPAPMPVSFGDAPW